MKLRKLIPALAFVALSLVGCKKDNPGTEHNQDPAQTGTTYMSFSFTNASSLRAGEAESDEHNSIGQWEGQEDFANARLYIFPDLGNDGSDAPAQVVAVNELTQSGANSKDYEATSAWKTTPGPKKVYAVVNLNDNALKTKLDNAAKQGIAEFEKVYNAAEEIVAAATVAVKEDFAKVDASKDKILITGEPVDVAVADNVTADEAKGGKNQAHIYMRRLVARVLTTQGWTGTTYEKKEKETVIFTLKDVKWSYAQYEKTSYLLYQDNADGHLYTPASKVKSPNYAYVPAQSTDYTKETAGKYYDYKLVSGDNPTFYALPELTRATSGTPSEADVAKITSKDMKFITETTHEAGTSVSDTKYRKGNTPYVLIRATYVPGESQMGFKEDDKVRDTYTEGNDLYYGQVDGKFYGDYALAVKNNGGKKSEVEGSEESEVEGDAEPAPETEKQPVKGDNVITYKKGVVYYTAWVNPDVVDRTKWFKSPVVRNNIYHIHITGFSKIGYSGNPFNPDPEDPNNPDPDEPTPNPNDPLPDTETYMHAKISVIKWGVHSYDIEL